MPVFIYEAVRSDGTRSKGSLEAVSSVEAKRLLREQQLIILSLQQAKSRKKQSLKLSFEQKVIFTTQLAQLLGANVPLYESLEALEEQADHDSSQPMIAALREQIRKGQSLSQALALYPETFSPLFRAIVASGESVGKLDESFYRLRQLLSSERVSRQRLLSALLYPSLLLCLLLASFGVLVFFVIPSIQGLFEGQELPLFTSLVFSFANMVDQYAWEFFFLFVCFGGWSYWKLSQRAFRKKVQSRMLLWPMVGPYLVKSSLARFSLTLSHLLSGGTPLNTALELAKESLTNPALVSEVDTAIAAIIAGHSFSFSLLRSPYIPPLFARMIVIGEETGQLAPIL